MSDNDTSSSSGSDDANNRDYQIYLLTILAFVVSLIAFFLSALQSLLAYLQFDNSEIGRRRCSEEVMGKEWAAKTYRKYKWNEFRYQIFFEVPVFYTAPPGITVGPITLTKPVETSKTRLKSLVWNDEKPKETETEQEPVKTFMKSAIDKEVIKFQPHVAPIYKITGTQTSYHATLTNFTERDDGKWANVHTAEDEGCSWVLLLDALQAQERTSRTWDRGANNKALDHTIVYLIQRKTRCWDFMPLNATKPFATTTICHLVEIMSMLGLVWYEFDVKNSTLSAEGNGYMVKSEYAPSLGILSRFSRLSRPVHEGNRIIPCKEVKRLCFGEVPSLFDAMGQKLQVGPKQLEECLVNLLPDLPHPEAFTHHDKTAKPPLPSPIFELIAMVATSAHIPGSRFRRLPNPCAATPPILLNAAAGLAAFAARLRDYTDLGTDELTLELKNAFEHGRLDGNLALDVAGGRTLEQLLHNYTASAKTLEDERAERFFAPANERDARKKDAEDRYNEAFVHLLDALHLAVVGIDQRLKAPDMHDEVRRVLARHFSELFHLRQSYGTLIPAGFKEVDLVALCFNYVRPAVVRGHLARSLLVTGMTAHSRNAGLGSMDAPEMLTSAVWLALNFRMWAWLFLHEFNPLDKMIERTEYLDSRLPIYIG